MAQELVKLRSIAEHGYYSRNIVVNKGDTFEDTPGNAKYLVGRGLAEYYQEAENVAPVIKAKELVAEVHVPSAAEVKPKKVRRNK